MSLEARLQATTAEYQKIQADLSNVVEARQRLDAQLSENELVKKELTTLTPNNVVFKLVGPVLVKQDQAEAKGNVDKRLEFIRGEIKRIETQLEDMEQKSEKKKLTVRLPALMSLPVHLNEHEYMRTVGRAADRTAAAPGGGRACGCACEIVIAHACVPGSDRASSFSECLDQQSRWIFPTPLSRLTIV
ncbi:Prefoldin [Gloeopeniophorella convolvens]|nr:Prefoldin [Gloeopeniophorella convolvens]